MAWYDFLTDPFGQKKAANNLTQALNTRISQGGGSIAALRPSTPPVGRVLGNGTSAPVPQSMPNMPPSQQVSSGGGGGEPDFGYIDSIYGPAMQVLSEKEAQARAGFGQAKAETGQNYDTAIRQSQEQFKDVETGYQTKESEYGQTLRSALEEAVRNYNTLQQNASSRFGRGSSAGGAASEIIGQEYARQEGGIRQTYINEVGKLKNAWLAAQNEQKRNLENLNLQRAQALTQLERDLQDTISQISAARASTESAKAQAKYQALAEARSRADAIKLGYQNRAAEIREQVAAAQAEISGNYQKLLEIASSYDASANMFGAEDENALTGSDLSYSSEAPTQRRLKQNEEDEFSVTNPFYTA